MSEQVGRIDYEISADTRQLIGQTRVVERETAKMAGAFNAITRAVQAYAAVLVAVKVVQLADDMRLLSSRIEVAAGSVEKATAAMLELASISTRTQTSMAANAQVFQRLNQSLLQMGGTQADTLRLTELLGMAVKVSGASAVESASAMLQFGQALGSGKLAGDELRSLLENAPYLMRQLAAGIGVPVGALKKLGEEGKLTADVVVNALQKAAGQIEGDFAKMPQTLGAAFTTAVDALQRLIGKADEASGTSAVLTGVTKGLADGMEGLSKHIDAVTVASDGLGRNTAINTWAERTRLAFSYVADGLDWLERKMAKMPLFKLGMSINENKDGIIEALFGGSRRSSSGAGSASSEPPLAGQQMRDRWESEAWSGPGAGPARGRVPPPSKLKAVGGTDSKAAAAEKRAADKRASDYADSLEKLQKIDDEARELGAKSIMDEQKKKERAAEDAKRAQDFARGVAAGDDPVQQLQLEIERKQQVLEEGLAAELLTRQQYAAAMTSLEQMKADRLTEIRQREIDQQNANNQASLSMAAGLAGDLFSLLEKSGRDRTALGKALFLTSKALAVAEIIMNTEVAAAKAKGQFGVYGIPMATMIRATGYASAAMVTGMAIGQVAGGRQYGGPVSAGSLYRVNETGRSEMFTAANGSQFLMPSKSGHVTAADKIGGQAPQWSVIVNNAPPGTSAAVNSDARTVTVTIAEAADQITSRRGPMWAALQSTNVRGRL